MLIVRMNFCGIHLDYGLNVRRSERQHMVYIIIFIGTQHTIKRILVLLLDDAIQVAKFCDHVNGVFDIIKRVMIRMYSFEQFRNININGFLFWLLLLHV